MSSDNGNHVLRAMGYDVSGLPTANACLHSALEDLCLELAFAPYDP